MASDQRYISTACLPHPNFTIDGRWIFHVEAFFNRVTLTMTCMVHAHLSQKYVLIPHPKISLQEMQKFA